MSENIITIHQIVENLRGMPKKFEAHNELGHLLVLDIENLADLIEAAYKREAVTDCNQMNGAKVLEALVNCAKMGEQIDCQLGSSDETVYAFRHERSLAHSISECARAALSAPPRNCDLPTVIAAPHIAWLEDCDNWDEFGNPKKEIHEWLLAKAKGGAE